MQKDYRNIITKENYEGYAELCLYKFLNTKKNIKFSIINALVVMLVGLGISLMTSFAQIGILITMCITMFTIPVTSLIIQANDIKKVLKKYPYIDNNIPDDELLNQLEKVGKENTSKSISKSEEVMDNFMEKLKKDELKKDIEPSFNEECELNTEFVESELEKYKPELLTEEKENQFVMRRH